MIRKKQAVFSYKSENSDLVILFIHGFLEGPDQFKGFADILRDKGISNESIILPGHGGSAIEFAATPLKCWVEYVENKIKKLKEKHHRVILVGHSMGTLLSLNYCLDHIGYIDGLVLLCTPLRIRLTPRGALYGMKVALNIIRVDDIYTNAMLQSFNVDAPPLLGYLKWIARYIDLFALSRKVRRANLSELHIKALLVGCRQDEFVSNRSLRILESNYPKENYTSLEMRRSGHFYYIEEERELLDKEFEKFIDSFREM